ncbi:MAG: hypothetical protein ACRC1K_17260 [Planctomycetia bacterium]
MRILDAAGRTKVVVDPLLRRTTTVYDRAGRLRTLRNSWNERTSYQYDAAVQREFLDE